MHLAGLMIEAALQNSDSQIIDEFLTASKEVFEALGFTTNTLEETAEQIYQLIRLAGLLHDRS